jgi:hypothetical protein
LSITDPTLLEDLRQLIEPVTLGDPMRPLLWVSKSHKKLAAALRAQGHTISPNTVRKLLHQLGYSRQANRKANDGRQHADRDAQFEHINARVGAFQADDQPVISVDTKKKELIGSPTRGRTTVPRASRVAPRCMTSQRRTWARWCPTVFMTWPMTAAGSASGSPATPPSSR